MQSQPLTWMPTWQHFLLVGFGTCVGNGWSKLLDPTLNPSPTNIFALNNQDLTLEIFNDNLMVSWG